MEDLKQITSRKELKVIEKLIIIQTLVNDLGYDFDKFTTLDAFTILHAIEKKINTVSREIDGLSELKNLIH